MSSSETENSDTASDSEKSSEKRSPSKKFKFIKNNCEHEGKSNN